MWGCALAFLLVKVVAKLLVGSNHRPRFLNGLAGLNRTELEATAMKLCDPNALKATKVDKLWKLPPSGVGRPLKGPSSTNIGNSTSKVNERLQYDPAMLSCFGKPSPESRT